MTPTEIDELKTLIVQQCCDILEQQAAEMPGYPLSQPPLHQQIYRLKKTFGLLENT